MQDSPSRLAQLLDRHLGRCPTCIKTAFLSACAGWLAVAGASMMWPAGWLPAPLWIVAIALTVLWLLHFAFYTRRVLAALWSEYIAGRAQPDGADARPRAGRREMIRVCAGALGMGLVAAVWLPMPAFAAGRPCGEGYVCPDRSPNCCSRSQGICCDGNWACTVTQTCHQAHADARASCGANGVVWACG